MSLIADYGSSSESEPETEQLNVITIPQPPPPQSQPLAAPKKKKIIVVPATPRPAASSISSSATPALPTDRSSGRPAPKSSIQSFLPAPKHRKQHQTGNPNTNSTALKLSKESRTLGGGGLQKQKFFDGNLTMATENESELVETSRVASAQQQKQQQPQQDVKVVPAAVLARQAKLEKLQKSGKPGPVSKRPRQFYPSVSNYNPQSAETATSITAAESKASEDKTTIPKRVLPVLFSGIHDEHESVELETEPAHGAYQPIMIEPQEETEPDYEQIPAQPAAGPESATAVSSQPDSFAAILSKHELGRNSRKRHRLHDGGDDAAAAQSAAEVIDFSVDDFYERNREANELEGNKPANVVRAIGGGKHQLSSLLRSAQNNREGLEEMFLQNKRTKKESGSKYGF